MEFNDARAVAGASGANLTYDYLVDLAGGPAAALASFALSHSSSPWAGLEATIAANYATQVATVFDLTRAAEVQQVADEKIAANARANTDASARISSTAAFQSDRVYTANGAHTVAIADINADLSAGPNYDPAFTPEVILPPPTLHDSYAYFEGRKRGRESLIGTADTRPFPPANKRLPSPFSTLPSPFPPSPSLFPRRRESRGRAEGGGKTIRPRWLRTWRCWAVGRFACFPPAWE